MWPHLSRHAEGRRRSAPLGDVGVIACIDGSNYLASVCDHAAWFADRLATSVELLTVDERGARRREPAGDAGPERSCTRGAARPARNPALVAAATRLLDDGVERLQSCTARGRFAPVAAGVGADAAVIVIGRRGASADKAPGPVGSAGPELLRLSRAPVCIAPRMFFPIHRALILPDQRDRRFADRVATLPCLDQLNLRLASTELADGNISLRILEEDGERRYPLSTGGLPRHDQPTPCDLVVLPRTTSLHDGGLGKVAQALLASRLPLLFC